MKTIEIKYNVNDEVWIYLAGEITKAIVTRIKYSESTSHRPILLYEVKEMDKGFSEWTCREEAMFSTKEALQEALDENRMITLK